MGRNNADFSKGLFHGSNHHFQPGDTVNPGTDGWAWSSTNKDVANQYGDKLYEVEPTPETQRVKAAAKEFGIYSSSTGYKVRRRVS